MSAAGSPPDPRRAAEIARDQTLDRENPWPWLAPYREGDAAFFRGREREALDLFLLVRRELLTVLFGLSGLGKTSLLFAGLFPPLRTESFLPVYIRINHDERAPPPVRQVIETIARAASAEGYESPRDDVETLWEYFHREDELFWSREHEIITPVLVFDQFEECFVEGRSTAARARRTADLFTQISDLVEGRPPASVRRILDADPGAAHRYEFGRHRYRTVISLRQDFLAELEDLRELMPSIANRFHLKRMTGDTALNVVQATGLVADDAAQAIVRYVAGKSTALPDPDREATPLGDLRVEPALLSLFCSELNVARRAHGAPRITTALFEANRKEILKSFYERCMQDRSPTVQGFVEEELLTQSGSRRNAAVEDILDKYGDVQKDIDALIDLRLLRREERDGLEWLELTHDRLTEVVRESRDGRHEQEAIQRAQEEARQAQQRRLEAEQREAAKRRQLRITGIALAVSVVMFIAAALGWINATRQQAVANYQNGLFRAQEGRARSALAYLARGYALDERVRFGVLLRRSAAATPFATGVFSGLLYTVWPLRTLSHPDGFNAAVLSGNAERIVTVASDRRVRVWNARTGDQIDPARTYGYEVLAAFVSDDGARVVTASSDGKISDWDAGSGAMRGEASIASRVQCAAFSADGSVVMASRQGQPEGQPAHVWRHHDGSVVSLGADDASAVTSPPSCPVAFSANGTRVVTALGDGRLQLWDAVSGRAIGEPGRHGADVTAVASSPDGSRVVSAYSDGVARLWDADLRLTQKWEWQSHEGAVRSVMFSADGSRMVSAADDRTAQVWNVTDGGVLVQRAGAPLRHEDRVWSASFNSSDTRITTASADGTVQVWDARQEVRGGRPLDPHQGSAITGIAFSPDGRRLVTASEDGNARLWDLQSGEQPLVLPHRGPVFAAAFDRTGDWLVTGARDCGVRLWDGRTGVFVREVGRHGKEGDLGCGIQSVGFDFDGARIVSASQDTTARVWDARSNSPAAIGKPLEHQEEVLFVGFTRDGSIVTASPKQVRVWDTHTGEARADIVARDPRLRIWSASLSRDARRVVFTTENCEAQVVDLEGHRIGERLRHPRAGGDCAIRAAGFGPDGNLVVTASNDGTARLWDARTGARIGEPLWHQKAVSSATFSPDGRQVATASADGTVWIWDVSPPAPVSAREVVSVAELVAGARVDAGGVVRMTVDRDRALCAAARARSGKAGAGDLFQQFFSQRTALDCPASRSESR